MLISTPSPHFAGRRTLVAGVLAAATMALTGCASQAANQANSPDPVDSASSAQPEEASQGTEMQDPAANSGDRFHCSAVTQKAPPDTTPAMERLAEKADQVAQEMGSVGQSAAGVNRAIEAAFGVRLHGNAYQMPEQLLQSGLFEEVHGLSPDQIAQSRGLVVVLPMNAQSRYGHIVVTQGNDCIASDHEESASVVTSRPDAMVFRPIAKS